MPSLFACEWMERCSHCVFLNFFIIFLSLAFTINATIYSTETTTVVNKAYSLTHSILSQLCNYLYIYSFLGLSVKMKLNNTTDKSLVMRPPPKDLGKARRCPMRSHSRDDCLVSSKWMIPNMVK